VSSTAAAAIETDAVVVGAGPVGLFQVFQLGLHELRTQLVDSLPAPGGQCIALYPDKPIYDIPGVPRCTGRELVRRLVEQIAPFGVSPHLGQEVERLAPQPDGRFMLETSAGTRFLTRIVVVAGGVGSFQPRRIRLDGLSAHEGRQVFYGPVDAERLTGQRVLVVGDADEALEAAVALAQDDSPRRPASVTLMHRREEFRAAPATVARMRALRDAERLRFVAAQPAALRTRDDGRLAALQLATAQETTEWLETDVVLAFTGLSPRLGPIAQWGLHLERKHVVVDPARFETSTPGIFAVGDIVHYPGKRKLILCGFHEATLAAFAAAERVHPERDVHLEYTTTSPRLHRLLGVEHERSD
jgi:thioredoxin reductase (NADPH)